MLKNIINSIFHSSKDDRKLTPKYEIVVGCKIENSDKTLAHLPWPRVVTKITSGPEYAGGKFVWVNGNEGYYFNSVKRVA